MLNSTFVRFVTIQPTYSSHPSLLYLNATFEKAPAFSEEMTVYIGRVIVDVDSSYVSLDLSDATRDQSKVKTIEIEEGVEEFIYSSIYQSYFNELVIVFTREAIRKGSPFSIPLLITVTTVRLIHFFTFSLFHFFTFSLLHFFTFSLFHFFTFSLTH